MLAPICSVLLFPSLFIAHSSSLNKAQNTLFFKTIVTTCPRHISNWLASKKEAQLSLLFEAFKMAVEVAMEDDLFFADLNRQISLLIDDDEEDLVCHFPSVSPQGFSELTVHPPIIPPQYLYQENNRREMSKGTGVFIPQSSQPSRRKYKQQQGKRSQTYAKSNNKQLIHNHSKGLGRSQNAGPQTNFSPSYATNINRY